MQICGVDVHPDMEPLLSAKAAIPDTTDPEKLRQGWDAYGAALWRDRPSDMKVHDQKIDCPGAGVDGKIAIRVYRPADAKPLSPAVLYLHGGAFKKGSLDSGDTIAWGIADRMGVVVVSVDYRLAPEHPFPAAPEDCYAAVKYLSEHGAELGIDGTRLAIWGDSAGGNLTAVVCLMARDRGGPKILGQAPNYATFTDDLSAEAFTKFADAPITTASVEDSWETYLEGKRPTDNPYAAPLKAADLSNLPPAHIHYAEIDCLADDSIQYAKRLEDAGNRVVLREAKGMIHGYLRSRFHGPQAAAEFDAPCLFLKEVLGN